MVYNLGARKITPQIKSTIYTQPSILHRRTERTGEDADGPPRENHFLSPSISWQLNLRNMIVSATFNIEVIGRIDSASVKWNNNRLG